MSDTKYDSVADLADFYADPTGATELEERDEAANEAEVSDEETEALEGDTDSDKTPDESSEDGPEDEEADADEDADTADEGDGDEELDLDQLVPIKIDGQDEQVTLKELQDGYLRHSDYTRKTMAHAEEVKAFKAEAEAVKAEREAYSKLIPQIEQQLHAAANSIDWEKLKQEDYVTFLKVREEFTERDAALKAEKARLAQAQEQANMESYREHLQSQAQKMFEKHPEWATSQEAWEAARTNLLNGGQKYYGFSSDEMANAADHRFIDVLEDALKYRALKEKTSKPAEAKAGKKAVTPTSSTQAPRRRTAQDRAMERLSKPGSVKDLADLYRNI